MRWWYVGFDQMIKVGSWRKFLSPNYCRRWRESARKKLRQIILIILVIILIILIILIVLVIIIIIIITIIILLESQMEGSPSNQKTHTVVHHIVHHIIRSASVCAAFGRWTPVLWALSGQSCLAEVRNRKGTEGSLALILRDTIVFPSFQQCCKSCRK